MVEKLSRGIEKFQGGVRNIQGDFFCGGGLNIFSEGVEI